MKRLLVIGFLGLLALGCFAQEVQFGSTVPIAWDAVTVTIGTVSYEVFLTPFPYAGGQEVSQGVTTLLEYDIAVPEGRWLVGVRAIKTEGADEYYSDINWSHVNGVDTPNPFYLKWFTNPSLPTGLRVR